MSYAGAHVSASGGVENAPANAAALGANAFALFVKNQLQWRAAELSEKSCARFREQLAQAGIEPRHVLPHAGYLINLCAPDEELWAKSTDSFLGEVARVSALGLTMLNIHPGSSRKMMTTEEACARAAKVVSKAQRQFPEVTIVLENTAGQGACLGGNFEELAAIIAQCEIPERVKVCVDTAHLYGAGFDISTTAGIDKTFEIFDRALGAEKLAGMHLNDTAVPLGKHGDRHAPLGEGAIGWEVFDHIAALPRCANIPLILETPKPEKWPDEIKRLRARN